MARHESRSLGRERGFSLIEVLIVVALISIMAALAYPGIARYIRNYTIRTAARDIAGALQATRSKAVMSNTNQGVSFMIVDADSYRYVNEDLVAAAAIAGDTRHLSPVMDLPQGVRFQLADSLGGAFAGTSPSVRFRRLGGYCYPVADANCAPSFPAAAACPSADAARCTLAAGANYVLRSAAVAPAPGAGEVSILLREMQTGLVARVRLRPGGRVATEYSFAQ